MELGVRFRAACWLACFFLGGEPAPEDVKVDVDVDVDVDDGAIVFVSTVPS